MIDNNSPAPSEGPPATVYLHTVLPTLLSAALAASSASQPPAATCDFAIPSAVLMAGLISARCTPPLALRARLAQRLRSR